MWRITILFALLINCNISAQRGNYWAFHYHDGLDFNYEPPRYDSNAIWAFSSGSICNDRGKLQMYMSKWTVWNSNNHVILDIRSIFKGLNDGSQDILILPYPGKEFIYSCFLINNNYNTTILNYFEIDLTLNAGEGGYVQGSKRILRQGGLAGLTAIKNDSNNGYWVISRCGSINNRDTILAFPFTNKGIGKAKINVCRELVCNYTNDYRIRASNDGKLLLTTCTGALNDRSNKHGSFLYSYSFDKRTGQFSDQRIIESSSGLPGDTVLFSFLDVAFSGNDSMIYVIDVGIDLQKHNYYLWQYKKSEILTTPQRRGIKRQVKSLLATTIQLGPNGKLYCMTDFVIGQPAYASVINYPDSPVNSCHFLQNSIKLHPWPNNWGSGEVQSFMFPNIFFEYLRVKFKIYPGACGKAPRVYNLSDTTFKTFTWYWGQNDSINGYEPKGVFKHSGKYFLKLRGTSSWGYSAWYSDSISYFRPPKAYFTTSTDTGCKYLAFKFLDSSYTDTVAKGNKISKHWDFGDGSYTAYSEQLSVSSNQPPVGVQHIYTRSGQYAVRLIVNNGICTDTFISKQKIVILDAPRPGFELSASEGCAPLAVDIKDLSQGVVANYHYSFGDGGDTTVGTWQLAVGKHLYTKPGVFRIIQELKGPTGCVTKDSQLVRVHPSFTGKDIALELVSVAGDNSITIRWQSTPGVSRYKLSKAKRGEKQLPFLTALPFRKDTFITDKEVNTSMYSYSYVLSLMDSCGKYSSEGQVYSSVLLRGRTSGNEAAILEWTPIEPATTGLSYAIERRGRDSIYYTIEESPDLAYRDVAYYNDTLEEGCYRISANPASKPGLVSHSNVLCLPYTPQIWIPTAFSPNADGLNDVFSFKAIGMSETRLTIFDRWGEVVYQSSAPKPGWDGRLNGLPAPAGAYLWIIKYTSNKNEPKLAKGSLQLLR
jgi:gliding motility-associated-like protein